MNEVNLIEKEALSAVESAATIVALDEADTVYLGRKNGKLTELMRLLGSLPPDEKPAFGQAINVAKASVENAIADKRAMLATIERTEREKSEAIDVTLPGKSLPMGRLHPLTLTFMEVKRVMTGLGFEFVDGPDVEDYLYNFDWLNYPPDHPAMDEQDSFYIADTPMMQPGARLLRTHCTGTLQGRVLETKPNPPFRIATLGRCYRNDDIDETHSHTFHQVDGFSIGEGITLADLKGIMAAIFKGLFGPDAEVRFRPDFFPFVEPGVEVAIRWKDPNTGNFRWLELGGAGLIHPNILKRAGYDTEKVSGFAFGFGVDRMPMLKYGVNDLRVFLQSDLRVLKQF